MAQAWQYLPNMQATKDVKVRVLVPETRALWAAFVVRSGNVEVERARVAAEFPAYLVEAAAL